MRIFSILMILRIVFLIWSIVIYKKLYRLVNSLSIYKYLPYEIYTSIKIKEISPGHILFIIPSINLLQTYYMIKRNLVCEGIDLKKASNDLLTHSLDIKVKYSKECGLNE